MTRPLTLRRWKTLRVWLSCSFAFLEKIRTLSIVADAGYPGCHLLSAGRLPRVPNSESGIVKNVETDGHDNGSLRHIVGVDRNLKCMGAVEGGGDLPPLYSGRSHTLLLCLGVVGVLGGGPRGIHGTGDHICCKIP